MPKLSMSSFGVSDMRRRFDTCMMLGLGAVLIPVHSTCDLLRAAARFTGNLPRPRTGVME